MQALTNLERTVDENAEAWAQFFDLIDTHKAAAVGSDEYSLRFWIISQALRRIVERHLTTMPPEMQQAFFERFLQPL